MEFNEYVRSLGLDPLALTPEAISALEASWRASNNKQKAGEKADKKTGEKVVAKTDDSLEAIIADTEAENERRNGIMALVRKNLTDAPERVKEIEAVGRLALSDGWTVKDTEFHLLKQRYANGPQSFAGGVHTPSTPQITQAVLEASVCRAAGLDRETVEASFGDQVLTAADKHFKGGCGLQRLLTVCAQANGHRDAHISDIRRLLTAAFSSSNGALASGAFGPSTYDVSGILSNVANKFIIAAFNGVESVWRQISAIRPVNDFKQITSYALTGDLTYQKVGPGGEVKHGTLGEQEYTNQAAMYGKMLGIDYQHLRNDDLDAFSKVNKRLGRGGALTLNTVFWTAFLAGHGTFWAAANGNYLAGTDYAFTLDKLGNADAAWGLRTDPDGQPMGDEAKFLLVPRALSVQNLQYMTSTRISADGNEGENNVLAGKWIPLTSVYLSNSSITGYSASNYYLIADPAETPVIETVFLDGQEMPTVETAEPDLSRMGIMLRGTHAFGVAKQEPRGGYKFKQTAD